jgi:truncated hemoglobin YjbI
MSHGGVHGAQTAALADSSLEHYALCRCGQSQNKPFCSGMHWYVDFHDPIADPERTPSMFEWAGGLPALTRITRLFYEKYVPEDPLLAPLLAGMSADHPERVAKWLGEVFGGPPAYSSEYGGSPRMLSQHVGKNLKEDWRARWVTLLPRARPRLRTAQRSRVQLRVPVLHRLGVSTHPDPPRTTR